MEIEMYTYDFTDNMRKYYASNGQSLPEIYKYREPDNIYKKTNINKTNINKTNNIINTLKTKYINFFNIKSTNKKNVISHSNSNSSSDNPLLYRSSDSL